MSLLLKGVIRNGRVEFNEPINLPDGTGVVVASDESNEDELMSAAEIASTLAAMQRLQPFDIPGEVEADLTAWENKLNQHGIDHVDSSAEDVFQ
jgi:hypothetical protein